MWGHRAANMGVFKNHHRLYGAWVHQTQHRAQGHQARVMGQLSKCCVLFMEGMTEFVWLAGVVGFSKDINGGCRTGESFIVGV